jgi:hypothetical protein
MSNAFLIQGGLTYCIVHKKWVYSCDHSICNGREWKYNHQVKTNKYERFLPLRD